jgi:hypothetical protein
MHTSRPLDSISDAHIAISTGGHSLVEGDSTVGNEMGKKATDRSPFYPF